MLFLLFGSSCSGKTAALERLRGRIDGLALHDFDEIGVPPGADKAWRHREDENWVRRALEYQAHGIDLLLAGQTPFGELLATPSAPRLEAVSACLLDGDHETRLTRLRDRGAHWLARSSGDHRAYLGWAAWLRGHAADPTWNPGVLWHHETAAEMHWDRWSTWRAGDPRWRIHVVDTSRRPVEDVANELVTWIARERELLAQGRHPLLSWQDEADAS